MAVAHHALHDLFVEQAGTDFAIELAVEPGGKPPDLRARASAPTDQARLGINLIEIFDDRLTVGIGGAIGLDQHRYFAAGIEAQQFLAPFARPLLHQFKVEVLLAKDDPESAAEWL